MKKLYQVLIICDDFAPQTSRRPGYALHQGSAPANQHLNQQFLCCWRLRNQHELDAVIEELSALLPKDKLHRIYEQATREPYSFLFVYYLKPKNQMFHMRFEERFALEREADGSGAQLPGPEAVR